MKEEILKLRNEGKTYNEIKKILNCSKGTISYHCGDNQKEKNRIRNRKRRNDNILISKVSNYIYRKKRESIRKFQKRDNNTKGKINKNINYTFNWKDVLNKFSENTKCYLSGMEINLYNDTYSFDHIVPVSKGGTNDISNLGITYKVVNDMKGNLMVNEFLDWCIKILEYNNFTVTKNE